MGDRSPKSNQKRKSQNEAKTASANQEKQKQLLAKKNTEKKK
jgi:hypothetical protein